LTNPTGVLVTTGGTIIQEDALIPASGSYSTLAVDTNAGNGSTRYDLVICDHSYIETIGGQNAIYSIVKGPLNNPILPAVPNIKTQIVVGMVAIPAGASTLSGATWTRASVPHLGAVVNLRLKENGYLEKAIGYKIGSITLAQIGISGDVSLTIQDNGSRYQIDFDALFTADPSLEALLFSGLNPSGSIAEIIVDPSILDFPDSAEIIINFRGLTAQGYSAVYLKHKSSALSSGNIEVASTNSVNDNILIFDGAWVTFKNMGSYWAVMSINYPKFYNLLKGGTTGQFLKKNSNSDFDFSWTSGNYGIVDGSTILHSKVIQIGDWNMSSSSSVSVAHGIADYTKIRSVSIMVRDDSGVMYPLALFTKNGLTGGYYWFDSTTVILQRIDSSNATEMFGADGLPAFTNTNFDATSYNRGWITITYEG
jgi:hypothetical protein